ncbi:MAG: DEAD/DEAH box helicase [Oscillospiraceae bacterium]
MSETKFSELEILPEIRRAIETLGFETATSIQSQAIPMIKTGVDVIGRSQTGTGKTIAFGIPALEAIDVKEEKNSLQVMILCPTRELAQQACEEIKKLSEFMHGIKAVEVYGGVPMDRQIIRLKKANIVIGTPGRIMDHMRRKTLKVNNLKMIVLDEADEMLSMGFKEDIETILTDTPADRQTVLFSATMPASILSITKQFQKNPTIIEIDKKNVTLDNIEQFYIDAPMGRKMDALNLVLRFHQPKLAMIFANTKRMVDEITEYLCKNDFQAEGLHGDMKQSQRTKVMDSFKFGKTSILVATDVAARGIDVNDIEYVINFDIPQNTEYYIHRIGRTGRAGKAGKAITLCSGRRQVFTMRDIGRMVKSDIKPLDIPTLNDIQIKSTASNVDLIEKALVNEPAEIYTKMVNDLIEKGHDANKIAAFALELNFGKQDAEIVEIKSKSKNFTRDTDGQFRKIVISIGRDSRVAPNHIVGAITELTALNGSDIGKIEIFDNRSVVAVPSSRLEEVVDAMLGCKICGKPTTTMPMMEENNSNSNSGGAYRGKPSFGRNTRPKSTGGYDRRRPPIKKDY